MNETFICDNCGEELPLSLGTAWEEHLLCPRCLGEETVLCQECGQRLGQQDNAGTEDHPLCQGCFDDGYTNCVHCGALLRASDTYYEEDEPLCDSCFYASKRKSIHDYYYKPQPIFYGEGPRYFGVELEIGGAGESPSKAQELLALANAADPHIYCKHDGSLEDGFEIVTHPMSLDYHQRRMPWREILEKAISQGYRSHQARTCGLHVHVNRNALGDSEWEQDAVIARILYFFEKHWEELLTFSRRTQRQLEQWANRYGYQDHPMEILDNAKKGYGGGRYSSINLQNRNTIEFRIFRGTLKYNTLCATLQLVNRVCEVALLLSDQEVKGLSWSTFAAGCQEPELVQSLKERRIYVNDPIQTEEEL